MKNILIIVCSGTYNRGTEALVRGTIQLFQETFGNINVTLSSSTPNEDSLLKLPYVSAYIPRVTKHHGILCRIIQKISRLVSKKKRYDFSKLVEYAKRQDIILVVGADNYDVAYNAFEGLHTQNVLLKKECRGKLFLYDCSLNKDSVTEQFIDEAKMFDAFSVREHQTLENLKGKYNGDNLYYFPDPAFIMPPQSVELPKYWKANTMVGINLSTLIVGFSYGSGLHDKVIGAYKYMMDKILEETQFDIVLIPHVMKRKDLAILEEIKELYKSNGRVHLISNEDYKSPELKYIISSCRFFVGARTHATIAAYSSCVPTLVLGYSTKSIGIAQDLFGTEEGYVISIKDVKQKEDLWNGLENIIRNEKEIKAQLQEKMPHYQEQVYSMTKLFKELLEK